MIFFRPGLLFSYRVGVVRYGRCGIRCVACTPTTEGSPTFVGVFPYPREAGPLEVQTEASLPFSVTADKMVGGVW